MAQGQRRINDYVEVLEDNMPQVQAAIRRLAATCVMVGIPSDTEQPHMNEGGGTVGTDERHDPGPTSSGINNATLGYIHEHGSPARNIPARAWLGPGTRLSRGQWEPYLIQAGKAAFEGKPQVSQRALNAAGVTAVSAIKNRIVNHIMPPLSQRTIDARRARVRSRQATAEEDVTPLVDTAQMLNAISYVIRQPRGEQTT